MRKRYLMTAWLCAVSLAVSSFAGAVCAQEPESAQETTEIDTEAGEETEQTEEQAQEGSESEAPARPDYEALDYVTLGEYKGLNILLDPKDFEITDEEIDQEISQNIEEKEAYEEISEGTVAEGDIANIDFVGKLDGEAFEGGSDEDFDLEIGSGTFIDGFEDGLIGVSVGETVDLPLTFPENYGSQELAGKDVIFTVTVNQIKRMPEQNDELAGKLSDGEYADMASYRAHIAEELLASRDIEQEKKNWIYRELLKLVANNSTVNDYPQEMVDYGASNMRTTYQQYAVMYGMEFAEFLESYLYMTEEEFEAEVDHAVKESLEQEMYLRAIAETEQIDLTDEEYTTGCANYAQQYGYETADAFEAAYGEDLIRLSLIEDKVMEFLLSNAVVEEVSETESDALESEDVTE